MATVSPIADQPRVVTEVLLLPLADIDVGERLRPIDVDWALALGRIMAVEGQRTPIEVCRLPGRTNWRLVAGAHRVAGLSIEGATYVEAIEVSNDALDRRLREVSENIWRRDLDPLDRAAFVAELVTLQKLKKGIDPAKDGRSASAQVRWQKALKDEAGDATDTMSVVYGWADEVGVMLGLDERTVRRDLLLHRRLSAGIAARLRGHPIAKNATQLRALAKAGEHQQAAIVDLLLTGKAKRVGDALAVLANKATPDAETKRLSAFIGAFQRMGLAEKKGALAVLASLLPKGFTLAEEARS